MLRPLPDPNPFLRLPSGETGKTNTQRNTPNHANITHKQYLALTLGGGAAATSAKGATVVEFYGESATLPTGLLIESSGYDNKGYITSQSAAVKFAAVSGVSTSIITDGSDLGGSLSGAGGVWFFEDTFLGAASSGDQNYLNISFNGNDQVYEAVAQFYLEGPVDSTANYLVAIARNDDNSALSISDGKAAIDAAVSAVPEPASNLSLLALGASGLLLRRRAKRAA